MKRVLCFGDSNTWGCNPHDSTRFDEKTRWPMVMGALLGEGFFIIEDGLNGRTVLNSSPVNISANGIESINSMINNYLPVDIAIISLGTNDVFITDEVTLDQISDGIEQIISTINNAHIAAGFRTPETVLMAPAAYNTNVEGSQFYELQINKLKALPEAYKKLSERINCRFFNAADFVSGSELDGSHLEAESHIILGTRIAEFILSRIK